MVLCVGKDTRDEHWGNAKGTTKPIWNGNRA